MSSEVNRLLNVNEAAAWLGVSASYLNKLRLTGGGPPYIKLGARICYDPADLADWIASQKRRSTSECGHIARFPDAAIRCALVAAQGEPWVISYIDPAAWDANARTIIAHTDYAWRKLCEPELRALFANLGVTIGEPDAGVARERA